ncbi:MAG: M20/M25/M40 family metallo-hydrolase [Acidobacteria bacterium]|nr:M20/M25/M40 family metallo-hydrolase [Acidobacteriota bacterium]
MPDLSRNWSLAALLSVFLVPTGARAQEASSGPLASLEGTVAELQRQALSGSGAYEFVRDLTTEVGPRSAGSPGDRAAVEWAMARLQALGFENVRKEPVTVPHWVRGEARGSILSPFPQSMVLTALGGSVATPEGGIEAEVLRVANVEALEEVAPEAVTGKIVFFDGGPMERARTGAGYGKAVQARALGANAAAPKGAVAVLIRSAGTSDDRIAHTGAMRTYEEGVPKIPAAALSNPDANLLSAQIDRGGPVRVFLELSPRLLAPVTSYNVIGEIVGREKPEEIVLMAAHLDSWDLGTGAVDDGAGCSVITEAARLIGKLPEHPRRTVRVLLTANEEFGLSGARAYAEAHKEELDRHVAAMESDFGSGRVWQFRSLLRDDKLPLAPEIHRLLSSLEIEDGGNEARGGADLSPLRSANIPIFDLSHDGTLYFDVHHTVNDTLERVVPESLAQAVAAYASVAYVAAELPQDLGRAPEQPEGERRRR